MEDSVIAVPVPATVRAGRYPFSLHFISAKQGSNTVESEVLVRYASSIIQQRWNDVLGILNEQYNGGYIFTSYQWYKNGEPIVGATSSILYVPEGLDLSAEYSVLLTRLSDNVTLMSCMADLSDLSDATGSVYIVMSSNSQSVEVEATNEAKLNVWSVGGVKVAEFNLFRGRNSLNVNGLVGLYIFEFIDENNFQEIQQVVLGK